MTTYVNLKSEITQQMGLFAQQGCTCYRTRLTCGCTTANRRNGALAVKNGVVCATIVKCKQCAKGGPHATV